MKTSAAKNSCRQDAEPSLLDSLGAIEEDEVAVPPEVVEAGAVGPVGAHDHGIDVVLLDVGELLLPALLWDHEVHVADGLEHLLADPIGVEALLALRGVELIGGEGDLSVRFGDGEAYRAYTVSWYTAPSASMLRLRPPLRRATALGDHLVAVVHPTRVYESVYYLK